MSESAAPSELGPAALPTAMAARLVTACAMSASLTSTFVTGWTGSGCASPSVQATGRAAVAPR